MIIRKSAREIERMRQAGEIVAGALSLARKIAKNGVTTEFINNELERYVQEREGIPVFKGYRGFPKSICTSINEEVVHGIPAQRKLCDGDIIGVDIGVEFHKYVADAATTIRIGEISDEVKKLLEVCEKSLYIAIDALHTGVKLSEIARSIQEYVESNGFSIVREYTGHGIGRKMHEDPQVPNFVSNELLKTDVVLMSGTALAIEPMICLGDPDIEVLSNKWTVVTKDRKPSAHFEHTVVVTENGAEILTK